MSLATVWIAIKDYLDANWSLTLVEYDNEGSIPPDASATRPWLKVRLSGNSFYQASIGDEPRAGNLWREEGLLHLLVFVPLNTGVLSAYELQGELKRLFRGLTLSPAIEFRDQSDGLGASQDTERGTFFCVPLSIEWLMDT